jgi:hypothetical protein
MSLSRARIVSVVSAIAVTMTLVALSPRVASAGLCGEFRWPIKSLADPDRREIDFHAKRTTLARLYGLDRPGRPVRESTPRIAPREFRTYKVVARLVKGLIEGDTDVKFVVSVPGHPEQTMAVEFLGSPCMESNFHRHRMLAARDRALEMCGPLKTQEFTALSGRVVLRGIGFWGNRRHEEIGGAPNHFQLIPVLGIKGTCRQV